MSEKGTLWSKCVKQMPSVPRIVVSEIFYEWPLDGSIISEVEL